VPEYFYTRVARKNRGWNLIIGKSSSLR